jgi:hypothetical protein
MTALLPLCAVVLTSVFDTSVSAVRTGTATLSTQSTTSAPTLQPDAPAVSDNGAAGAPVVLTVDGQLTPELVPDDLAYRHFLSVTAVGSRSSAADLRRRDAILEHLGLSGADRRAYIDATLTVSDALQRLDRQMEASHQDVSAVDALKEQKRQVLDDAARRVNTSLSAGGAATLRSHINERVKRHIRIYRQAIPMPGVTR